MNKLPSSKSLFLTMFNKQDLEEWWENKLLNIPKSETKLNFIIRKNFIYFRLGNFNKREWENLPFLKYHIWDYKTITDQEEYEQDQEDYQDSINGENNYDNEQLSLFDDVQVAKSKYSTLPIILLSKVKLNSTPLLPMTSLKELALKLFNYVVDFIYEFHQWIADKDKEYFIWKYANLAVSFMVRWEQINLHDEKYITLFKNEFTDYLEMILNNNVSEILESRELYGGHCSYF